MVLAAIEAKGSQSSDLSLILKPIPAAVVSHSDLKFDMEAAFLVNA
jgi:hypothetical protein